MDLVAPGIVNTVPQSTLDALADHGELRGDTIHGTYQRARQVFEDLAGLGIGYDDVVKVLEDEGVANFAASWQELAAPVKAEMGGAGSGRD